MSTTSAVRQGGRIVLRTPFELKDQVKRISGRQWDKPTKTWHVPATQAAAASIREHLGHLPISCDLEVLRLMADAQLADSALANKHRDDLPDFTAKTEAWNHQRQAFHFALPRDAAMLAMDMGTGKSKVAIGLLDAWDIDVAVILAPVKAVRVWPREFHGGDVAGFDGHSHRPWHVVNGRGMINGRGREIRKPNMRQRVEQADQALRSAAGAGEPCAIVVNYEAAWQEPIKPFLLEIRKRAERCYNRPVRLAAIFDESHKIKAPNGKWSKFCQSLSHRVDKRLTLTGTPNPHSEPDLFAQFRALDEGVFGTNQTLFRNRFFEMGGYKDKQIQGFLTDEAADEFERLFAEMAYICDSDDVLDLPEVHELPPITTTLGGDAAKHYAAMYDEFMTALDQDGAVAHDDEGEPVIAGNALAQLVRLAQITSGHLPVGSKDEGTHRIVTIGTEKADLLADVLDDLPTDEPIVVFGRFHHDLEVIQQIAEKTGRRYAEISGRHGVKDGLDEDGKMRTDVDLLGVQLQAGGVGIDLTAARYAVYYALDFNLGDFKQSRKRLHRPGQTRPVTFIFLALEGTVDEIIANALRNRDAILTALKDRAKHYHQEAA